MQHLRSLIESRPMSSRVPDQSMIVSATGTDLGDSPDKIVATRSENNDWALVYLTQGGDVTVDMTKISGPQISAQWYDPRDGSLADIGVYDNSGTEQFTAPSSGEDNDWVLVLAAQ